MESIKYKISNKSLFEEQLLTYFKGKKNIIFLNSNKEKQANLFAVSDSDENIKKHWKIWFYLLRLQK